MDLADIIASLQDLRDEELDLRGLAVDGTWDEVDDPDLLGPDGNPVDTRRAGYPYDERMSRHEYELTKRLLQIELLKLQAHVKANGLRLCLLLEGRDAAGKGGTIKRFMEHLNPRGARVVGADDTNGPGVGAVVLPAVHPPPAQRRRDRAFRPVLVQPGRRRAGDGLLHRRAVPGVHAPGPESGAAAGQQRDHVGEALVLGQPPRTGSPGSRSDASTRSDSGSSARWTWPP
jgi:hypothetical protein